MTKAQFQDYYVVRHPDGAWAVAPARMAKSGRIQMDSSEHMRIAQPGELEKVMGELLGHPYTYEEVHP
jgi:hypothetical protein